MSDDKMIWVRLKPYNPQFGYVKRRWLHSPSGIRLFDPGVWIRIPDALRPELEKKRQDSSVPTSPPLLDFAENEEEKLAVEQTYRDMVVEASRRAGRPVEVAVTEYTRENLRPRALSTLDLAAPEPASPKMPVQPTEVVDIEPPQEETADAAPPSVGEVEPVSIPAESTEAGDEKPTERKARRRRRSTSTAE